MSDFWAINYGIAYDCYGALPHKYHIFEVALRDFNLRNMGEIFSVQTDFMLDLDVFNMGEIFSVEAIKNNPLLAYDIDNDAFTIENVPVRQFTVFDTDDDAFFAQEIPNRKFILMELFGDAV